MRKVLPEIAYAETILYEPVGAESVQENMNANYPQ